MDDLDRFIEEQLNDPEFRREYLARLKEENAKLRKEVEYAKGEAFDSWNRVADLEEALNPFKELVDDHPELAEPGFVRVSHENAPDKHVGVPAGFFRKAREVLKKGEK